MSACAGSSWTEVGTGPAGIRRGAGKGRWRGHGSCTSPVTGSQAFRQLVRQAFVVVSIQAVDRIGMHVRLLTARPGIFALYPLPLLVAVAMACSIFGVLAIFFPHVHPLGR